MAIKKLTPPRSLGRALNYATGGCNTMCNAMLASHGLTLPQWVVLSALWRQNGLLVSEIADYTDNNGPAVSRILDRIEEKGLLVRRADPNDRRAVRVLLTDKGKALGHLGTFHRDVNARLLDGISEDEAALLFNLLERVEHNARRQAGDETEAGPA